MSNIPSDIRGLDYSAHILVISDDMEVARIWAFSLEQSGLKVDVTEMGEQALAFAAELLPDMLVVDSHAWQGEDIEFCRSLRLDTIIPLLLFTSQNDEYYLLNAYAAGVDEVVAQPVSPRMFMAKVRSWLRRAQNIPAVLLDEIHLGSFTLNEVQRVLTLPDGGTVRLTYLEARLLYLLMNHPERIHETTKMVERLWGHYGQGDNALLKNLVYRLRRKIEPDASRPRYLVTEGALGYRFNPEIRPKKRSTTTAPTHPK